MDIKVQKLIYIPSQVYYDILYPHHIHEIWIQKKMANMNQLVKLKHHLGATMHDSYKVVSQ